METEAYSNIFKIEERLWWYRGRRDVCFGLLDRLLPESQGCEILDVGCGTGYNLKLLERYGRSHGVDVSEEALRLCELRGVERVTLHDAEEIPFDDETFDLVTAFDVIEHVEDDRAALLEFRRLLKSQGRMLIYTPALPWMYNEHDRKVHHKRRYTLGELREKLETAGFEIVHISYVNLFILPIVLLARAFYVVTGKEHPEMNIPPEPFNWVFSKLCWFESLLVRYFTLPYGMSLVALVRLRPETK